MIENILKELPLKSKSVYLIFNMPYLLVHVDSSPGPSSFLPSAPLPSLSLPCPQKDFHLSQLSHFQTWLAVPHSPLDSSFFLHFPILTLTLPPRPSPLFRVLGIQGSGPHKGATHATVPWVCFWLSGSGVQTQLTSPLPGHTALTCPRYHVRSVIF